MRLIAVDPEQLLGDDFAEELVELVVLGEPAMTADVESELAVLGLAANRSRQPADKGRLLQHRRRDSGFGEHIGRAETARARAHHHRRSGLLRRRSVGCRAIMIQLGGRCVVHPWFRKTLYFIGEAAEQYRRAAMSRRVGRRQRPSPDTVYATLSPYLIRDRDHRAVPATHSMPRVNHRRQVSA